MVLALERFEALRAHGVRLLHALGTGAANAPEAARVWRQIVDRETDPLRRAEALSNLAAALDHLGEEGRAQAIAITNTALRTLGPKHRQAADAYLMAAQRLLGNDGRGSPAELRQALDYLHAALAVPMTAGSRSVLIAILVRYAIAAPLVGDFSKLGKAQHVFERLRKYGIRQHEVSTAYGAIVTLHEARWKAQAHRPSLGKAISLSTQALALFRAGRDGADEHGLVAFQQRHAILLMERYNHGGARDDFEAALGLLREASKIDRSRATVLNSLALLLIGSDTRLRTDAEFEEARLVLDEGLALASEAVTRAFLRWTDANWHLHAYWRGGPVDHLDRAVEAAEAAASRRDIIQDKVLFTLADVYYTRFRIGRDPDDIERAVSSAQLGLDLCSDAGAERWSQEVSAANAYQERAVYGRHGFDEDDADRAAELQRSALARLPRDSEMRNETAGTALGCLIERYVETGDRRILEAAAGMARLLPDTPRAAGRLAAIAAANLAVFHLHFTGAETDRAGWAVLLRDIATTHATNEAGWLAASNLMHFHIGTDWAAVVEAFQLLAKQRSSRLAAARTPRQRAMVLRREQSVASIAGLAYAHLGAFADAARLIDQSQSALLAQGREPFVPEDADLWASFDAILYPVVTRYGAYALTRNPARFTGVVVCDRELELPDEPAVPGREAMATASALVEAAFARSLPTRLLIIPAGALGSIPWAAVPVGNGMLIDHSQVSVLPTRNLWRRQTVGRPSDLLVVEAAKALPGSVLHHAEAEIRHIRRLIPTGTDLFGAQAVRTMVMDALDTAKIAHFACHGEADLVDPTRSRLILADGGALSVLDLFGVACSSLKLVCLSACRSAVIGNGLPDEFASLAMAFMVAGAGAALGTLWNVSDVAASLFSRRFFQALVESASVPAAARVAQLWLRDSSDGEKAQWLSASGPATSDAESQLRARLESQPSRISFKDPKYWAAFTCHG